MKYTMVSALQLVKDVLDQALQIVSTVVNSPLVEPTELAHVSRTQYTVETRTALTSIRPFVMKLVYSKLVKLLAGERHHINATNVLSTLTVI